jgi:hypothetical protein
MAALDVVDGSRHQHRDTPDWRQSGLAARDILALSEGLVLASSAHGRVGETAAAFLHLADLQGRTSAIPRIWSARPQTADPI